MYKTTENMEISVYVWETIHDQANETMTHLFENEVNCVLNWKLKTITLEYRNKVIDVFPFEDKPYTIRAHTRFLLMIASIAQQKYLLGQYTRVQRLKKLRHVFGL